MRDLIDQNPAARLVLIGVLAIGMMLLLYTRLVGQSEPESGAIGSTDQTKAASTKPARSVEPPSARSAPAADLTGLPAPVAAAYRRGKTIAVLITQKDGIEDRALRSGAKRLESRRSVALFRVSVKDVARYADIARGVALDRVPALIVIPADQRTRPLRAVIRQGYLDPAAMMQAVEDATFSGKTVPPYPG